MRRVARALLCALAAVALTGATSYQVNYGANQNITEWSTCKKVTNNSVTGKAIFVPTKTNTEWSSFYANPSSGVTAATCQCSVASGTNWTVGSSTCTVPSTLTINDGSTATATDSTAPTTGAATYACTGTTASVQSSTCTTAPSCGGKQVGGYCWYQGNYNASCTTTCASHGGYNAATLTYAGSSGTNANCKAVVETLIGTTVDAATNSTGTKAVGCVYRYYYDDQYQFTETYAHRYTTPATTEAATISAGTYTEYRACACNN